MSRILGWARRHFPLLLTIISLLMLLVGITTKEHLVMWRKAVNICLSCIGIG